MGDSPRDGFHVGYLAMPARHRRFLRVFVPAVMWVQVIVAAVLVFGMRDPGGGEWDTSSVRTWTGTIVADPYPRLVVGGGAGESLLLVEMGKVGLRSEVEGLIGARVEASGFLLERGGRRMIELEPGAGALVRVGEGAGGLGNWTDLGEVTLAGEIVDFKCYLGAMKPGDGSAHRACATLCVSGGIPPVLVVDRGEGRRDHVLLARADGSRANEQVLEWIARRVEVTGRLRARPGAVRLDLAAGGIRAR